MDDRVENGSRRIFPYLIYAVYTVYMAVMAVGLSWPSWVTAVALCILAAGIGLRILLGRQSYLAAIFCGVGIWVNVILYSVYTDSVLDVLGSVAAVVVLLSLFDVIEIHYISMAATILFVILNIFVLHKVEFSGALSVLECIMQFLAIFILELMEIKLLKDRIKKSRELAITMKELEEAKRAKDDFMANISHEIRTPLNSIIGIGNELLDAKVDDVTKEQLYDITVAGKNLMSLVSDILDFSELEADTIELKFEPYNITSVINDVVNMASAWNKEKNLELIVDCEANLPNSLLGDSHKIYRVILHLMNNAVKFTERGGVILFIGGRKEQYGMNLMIRVQDTGIGMRSEDIEALKNTYNQVDSRRDRKYGGIGLGLAISRKLVAKMGGHMHIESVPQVGTTITVIIPQKSLTDVPIVSVKDPEEKKAAFYVNVDRYQYGQIREGYLECIQRMSQQLQIKAVKCSTMQELKHSMETEQFGFVFTADEEYLENKEYFDRLSEQLQVVLMVNRDFDLKMVGRKIQLIYRPLHVFSVATVLNGERLQQDIYEERWHKDRFQVENAHILVVDDSAMNLKVAASMLRHYGVEIETALSGKEAIEKVSRKNYDLIFMDHMMPEMDGVECMQRLHELPVVRECHTPIVALTANAIGGAREMLMDEGFDDFVAKPIEKSAMERVLRKFLDKFVVEISADGEELRAELPDDGISTEQKEQENVWVKGIDREKGLSYFDHNEADYMDIIHCFIEQYGEQKTKLERFYEEKDWENYKIIVHSLKGQSLTIGAESLSEKAKHLQEAAQKKDEAYIAAHHGPFMEEYQEIMDGLEERTGFSGSWKQGGKPGQENQPESAENWSELAAALDQFDQGSANELIDKMEETVSGEEKEALKKMKDAIELFDFLTATEILQSLGGKEND